MSAVVLKLRLGALLRRRSVTEENETETKRALAIIDLTVTELARGMTDLDEQTRTKVTDLLDTALTHGWCGLEHWDTITAAHSAVDDFLTYMAWVCHWLRGRNSSHATIGTLNVLPLDVRLHIVDLIGQAH